MLYTRKIRLRFKVLKVQGLRFKVGGSMKVERFEDLEIWQLSRELCKDVYQITSLEPFSRDFKLIDQIRGSSGSIMDNIAEGFERGGNKEFIQFLSIAKGSCGETRSQLYRAFDCKYITEAKLKSLTNSAISISKKISTLMNYLKKSDIKGPKYKQ
nr:four helix bundle protein [Rhodohalobacter sp.]